jgi:hypothetical protein
MATETFLEKRVAASKKFLVIELAVCCMNLSLRFRRASSCDNGFDRTTCAHCVRSDRLEGKRATLAGRGHDSAPVFGAALLLCACPNRKEEILMTAYYSQISDWDLIPEHIRGSLRLYIEGGYHPGSGLTAILCNDLRRTAHSADDKNWAHMRDIVRFIYRYAPAESWGSVEKVEHWIEQGGLKGHKDLEDCPNLQQGEDLDGQHDA